MTYTIYEAANLIGVNPETVRRWIRSGKLVATMTSKRKVILLNKPICNACIAKTRLPWMMRIEKKCWKQKE